MPSLWGGPREFAFSVIAHERSHAWPSTRHVRRNLCRCLFAKEELVRSTSAIRALRILADAAHVLKFYCAHTCDGLEHGVCPPHMQQRF